MNCVLIGAGRIARHFHLPALLSMTGVHLNHIVEPDQSSWAGLPPGVTVHACLDQVPDGVQAAVICTPTEHHEGLTSAAWSRGWHVYLEKPVAVNLEQARRLLGKQVELKTMVGFTQRFRPANLKARGLLEKLGRPLGGQGFLGLPGELVSGWRRRRSSGGGALLEMACHQLDLLQWFFQDPLVVGRATLHSDLHEDDRAQVWVRLHSGFEFSGLYSLNSVEADHLELFGDRGRMRLQRDLPWPQMSGPYPPRSKWEGLQAFREGLAAAWQRLKPAPNHSFRDALRYFFDCVSQGIDPQPDLAHGVKIQAQLEALERSARQGGQVVEL